MEPEGCLFLNSLIDHNLKERYLSCFIMTDNISKQSNLMVSNPIDNSINVPRPIVAIELGYDSPSAFISMFKKAIGQTPGRFFK